MADTLEQIYMNTALGATQMDDGEETILTTNATTSYVIKDMNVNNTTSLTNTYLELNGFNVGSISSNATGSLIIPPSSTLKIKTTNYPFAFTVKDIYFVATNGKGYYKSTITQDGSSAAATTIVAADSSNGYTMPQYSNTIAMRYVQPSGSANAFLHNAVHDNNSTQKISYNRFGASNAQAANSSKSYSAHGFHDLPSGGYLGIISDGANFKSLPLSTTPTTTTETTFGNYSNNPTSSYPRGLVFGGYLWWIRSSSYNTAVYAINITTGHALALTSLNSEAVAGSPNRSFGVSLDPTTDKFYIWRPNSGSTMQVIETNDTKTVLDGKTADYTAPTTVVTARGNLPVALNETYMSTSVLTPQLDGTIKYQISNGTEYMCIDKTLSEVGDRVNITSMTIGSTTGLSAADRFYSESSKPATSAQVTASGLTAPTFGIQLLGVKSETS